MRVPAVGPEEEETVEQRLDVGHIRLPRRKDPQDTAVLLIDNNGDQLIVPLQGQVKGQTDSLNSPQSSSC